MIGSESIRAAQWPHIITHTCIEHPSLLSPLWGRAGGYHEQIDPQDLPPMSAETLTEIADDLRMWLPAILDKHRATRSLKQAITSLDCWSQSIDAANGEIMCDRLAGMQKFRHSSEQLLQCVRLVVMLKGGAPKLADAIDRAVQIAVPDFMARSLGRSLTDNSKQKSVASATTVRRAMLVLDIAMLLLRK